jgi:eukaryotic-like serine/threonine-protein kinase
VARSEALLEEARTEYKLALAAGRQELVSTDGSEPRKRAPTGSEASEGVTLAAAAQGRPLDAPAAEALVVDVSRALEALHGQGALHLDVTPASIARVRDPAGKLAWRLLDFAEAQRMGTMEPTAAQRYLAPERLRGQFADARADLYGLCASVYFALAGKEPFAEAAPHEVAEAVMSRSPRAIDGLSPPLAAVLARGLARSPANRFATAAELRDEFTAAFREAAPEEREEPVLHRPRRPSLVQRAASMSDTVRRAILGEDGTTSASETPAVSAWHDAYLAKMRGFIIGATVACAAGCLMLGLITRANEPRVMALACLAGIAGIMWVHWILIRRGHTAVYWPLAIAGALTTGPAYAFGLHSAFGSVITVLLFAGGLFRGTLRTSWADRRWLALAAISVAYTAALILVVTGVLPDRGNMYVIEPRAAGWEPLIKHLALLVVFAGAFFGGAIVDRNYQALMHRAEATAREAAAKEALLATARAELDALLANAGGGLFTGTRVAGYRVGTLLGRGGMGEVYRATDEQSGEVVAIKLLKRERIGDLRALRRFMIEATALARVHSPYVATVKRVAHPDDDLPFFAMEHIDGVSLSSMLRARERLDLALVQSIVQDIGRGLQDVHRAGVVHRDVKPNNILFTSESGGHRWKLVDFGAAKLLDEGSSAAASVVIGTPRYMAPEQAISGRADARSDLYSLSVVIYGALTGRPAFTGHDPAEIARQALTVGPPHPAQFVDLPDGIMICLRIGLAAQPEDRFATASELLAAFEGAFDGALDRRVRDRGLDLLRRAPWAR